MFSFCFISSHFQWEHEGDRISETPFKVTQYTSTPKLQLQHYYRDEATPLTDCQQTLNIISFSVPGLIARQMTVCVLQHDGLWHVQRPNVGVMLNVGTCVSAVCNPEKVILLERCTDFLWAQTLLGKKANCCEWERVVSLEHYFIITLIFYIVVV